MPESRSQHAMVAIGNQIYVIGGRTSGSPASATERQLWSYNVTNNVWNTNLPDMPGPREDHVAVAMGDTIWVFGGRSHTNMIPDADYWVVGSNQWQHAGEMPVAREGMGAVTINGLIYLIGGKASHSMWAPPVTRVDCFNPQTHEWSITDTLNQARVGFAWAAHGDTIMCAGGRFVDPLASVERRIDSEAWESTTTLSGPRSDGAAVFFQNQFILLGGIGSEGQADNNLVFDGENWTTFVPNLLPRYEETAVVVDNAIYIMGGRNGNQLLRSNEQFTVLTSNEPESVQPENMALISAFPNPFNGSVQLRISLPNLASNVQHLKIYNILGQMVFEQEMSLRQSVNQITLNGAQLGASGVYWVELSFDSRDHGARHILHKLTYLK